MKHLVTGGCGFIGSHLVDRLVNEGHHVIVIDNLSATSNDKFYFNQQAEYYEYDIRDYEKILPLFEGIDCVFHLAAESRIQPIIDNPRLAVEVNTLGTCNILEAARHHGVRRVMYSSTSAAYGLKNKPPLSEQTQPDCLNPYSYTKVAGEELCKMYSKMWNLETVIFRYFNVYGERQPIKGQYAPVVGLFLEQIKRGEPMTIVGDGEQRRDFTHVNDIVNANILASVAESSPNIIGEIFNVGTGKNNSVNELADLIGGERLYIPKRKGEAKETLANNFKIRKYLDWAPTMTLPEWLEKNANNV